MRQNLTHHTYNTYEDLSKQQRNGAISGENDCNPSCPSVDVEN